LLLEDGLFVLSCAFALPQMFLREPFYSNQSVGDVVLVDNNDKCGVIA
jgi:hypothetical protein